MMKNVISTLIVLLVTLTCSSQIAEYGKLTDNLKYDSYISKTGDKIIVGDTLIIGKASGEFGFIYITQGGERVVSSLAGNKVKITQIKSFGTIKAGYKLWVQFKGYGLVPVFIDYDNAIETGEIINPMAKMTRDQAINRLKESKDLLDLNVITAEEYEKLKNELTPIIIGKK